MLVTTLTKRTAEDLTDYLRDLDLKVRYLHSDIDAIERVEILRALRAGDFDILVGINLLREGLDLPEVSLVCILDADKEGFLRSETSLIQTAGRAARHINGEVVLFADTVTDQHPGAHRSHRLPPPPADRLQHGTRHHPADREARRAGKPAHDFEEQAGRGKHRPRSRRRLPSPKSCANSNTKWPMPPRTWNTSVPRCCAIRSARSKTAAGISKIEPKKKPVSYSGNNDGKNKRRPLKIKRGSDAFKR